MTIDVRPKAGRSAPAGSSQNAGRRKNMILLGIGVGLVMRVLRDRRFYTYAITAILVLVTGSKAAKENQTKSLQRLVDWNKRQTQRFEQTVKDTAHDMQHTVKETAHDMKDVAHDMTDALPG
jgi:hypothetical protein